MDHKEGTSSLIGVGIAVLANTLISAGLNVERLAHIKRSHTTSKPKQPRGSSSERTPLIAVGDPSRSSSSSSTKKNKIPPPRPPNYSRTASHTSSSSNRRRSPSHGSTASSSKRSSSSTTTAPRTDKGFLKSPLWLLGFSLVNLGEIGNFLAYGFAPTSLVAPLGMTALVANVGLAPLIVGESFRKKDLLGIAICLLGGVTVVYASRSNDEKITPIELIQQMKQPLFLIYSITSLVLIVIMFCLSQISKFGDRFVLIDLSLCAFVGAFTVLSTKALSSFLNTLGLGMFREPITYPLLLILLITAFTQVNFINKSLQRFESRIVIPTQYMTFSLWSVFGSAILYRDFKGIQGEKLLNFGFGCLVSATGVYYLTRGDDNNNSSSSEDQSLGTGEGEGKKGNQSQNTNTTESNLPRLSSSSSHSQAPPIPLNVSSSSSSPSTSTSNPSSLQALNLQIPKSPQKQQQQQPSISISISPTTRIILPSHSQHSTSLPTSTLNPVVRPKMLGGVGGGNGRTRTLSIGKYRFANGGLLLVATSPSPSNRNQESSSSSSSSSDQEDEDEDEDEEARETVERENQTERNDKDQRRRIIEDSV
ncbi:hypothetical protein JCM3765_006588 [Sporobolomyces pararoseus]